MAKFAVPKESVEGKASVPSGLYTLRCDGFRPKVSSKKDSYNMNPILKIIEPAEYADQTMFFNMNTNFGRGVTDFVHGFGQQMVANADGDYDIPGDWSSSDPEFTTGKKKLVECDPSTWVYSGPLLGAAGKVEIVEVPKRDSTGKPVTDGRTQNDIKMFLCAVPGCQDSHSKNLIGNK